MSTCKSCTADLRAAVDAFICRTCIKKAHEALEDLPVLLEELQVVRLGKARLSARPQTGKRAKLGARRWLINPDVMKLHDDVADFLADWTDRLVRDQGLRFFPPQSVGSAFIGPLPPHWRRLPKGYSGSSRQRAAWLNHHLRSIAQRQDAGEFVDKLIAFAGERRRPNEPGLLMKVVDRDTTIFAGICSALRGDLDAPTECGAGILAQAGDVTAECPKCRNKVYVAENRRRTEIKVDVMTADQIVKVMNGSEQAISRWRITQWARSGELPVIGWLHRTPEGSQFKNEKEAKTDVALYRLSRARALWAQLLERDGQGEVAS